ncbi:MAG: MBL fold metallo-hydrolase, partial [Thermotogota bacterium]
MMLKQVYHSKTTTVFKEVLPPVGVNTYLLYMNHHLFIVDPGIGSSKLPRINDKPYEDITLLITHSHFDHITGIDEFPDSKILITQEALPGLLDSYVNLSGDFGGGTTVVKNRNIQILSQGENSVLDCTFQVMIYPGHTQGDTVFDFGPFMFTGDFVFCDSIGRTDFRFSDNDQMKKSLAKFRQYLLEKEPTDLILPGHMGVCSIKKLLENNAFLSV